MMIEWSNKRRTYWGVLGWILKLYYQFLTIPHLGINNSTLTITGIDSPVHFLHIERLSLESVNLESFYSIFPRTTHECKQMVKLLSIFCQKKCQKWRRLVIWPSLVGGICSFKQENSNWKTVTSFHIFID